MLSNTDLSFHAPAAGLVGVDPAGAGNSSMFSRLHLVGNPDWLPSFSSSQQVVTARPVLVPPVPVASAPRPLAAPAAIDAPAPAAKGFFSMFYRASAATPSATAEAASVNRTTAGAPAVPAPPKALDALNSPPQRAMPVDAHLSLEHFSKSGVVEASMPAVRREPPRPLALGSDTWNAFSSVAPLPTTMSANGKHVLSPPAAIDGVVSRAPKPLWSDLSFTSRFRNSAPTLDAFRNVAAPPTPITTSPEEGGLLPPVLSTSALPVPPKPVTTSPLRDTASSLEAVASQRSESKPHPLVPVGEDALPVTPLLKPAKETTKTQLLAKVEPTPVTTPALPTAEAEAEAEAPQAAPLHHDGAVSPVLLDFVKSIAEPATQPEQKEEAAAAANVRNFLSTLFSRAEDAEPASTSKADAFNALELAINRGGTQPKTTQPLAYSTFASSPLFMDSNDEDSEEGLERLRRVVSIVMQSAKASESCNSQPSSQTQRRNGNNSAAASPAPGKYTEFSAIYHTTNNDASSESEWMQYARF